MMGSCKYRSLKKPLDEVSSNPQNVFPKRRNTSENYVGAGEEGTEGVVGSWPRKFRKVVQAGFKW